MRPYWPNPNVCTPDQRVKNVTIKDSMDIITMHSVYGYVGPTLRPKPLTKGP